MAKNPKDTSDEKEVKTDAAKKGRVVIDLNPTLESVDLLRFNKTAVVTFIKASPPTKEHDALIDHLYDVAAARGVDSPMVFIEETSMMVTSPETNETYEQFSYLASEDAYSLCKEAYGDIVQEKAVSYIGELLDTLMANYTDVILVLPAPAAKDLHTSHDIEVYSFDIDETQSAADMFVLATDDKFSEFEAKLAEGVEYLAEDIIELYQMYAVKEVDEFSEALDYAQRIKRGQIFRRNKRKIAVARERMRHKIASSDQLKHRARKKAIDSIRKKVAGARGQDYKNLGVGEKIQIDKRVEQRKGSIGRIAQKILPTLRKQEMQKMHKRPQDQHQHESFDLGSLPNNRAVMPSEDGGDFASAATPGKMAWHQMFNKDGSIKIDKRFKIWKNVHEAVDMVVDNTEVASILESLSSKGDEYNIDQSVIKELFYRGVQDAAYEHLNPVEAGFNRVNSFVAGSYFLEDLSLMEKAEGGACAVITKEELKELEKFADAILKEFDIDIGFTKHFGERMSDARNSPCITVNELRDFFRKIALKQGKDIKRNVNAEVVLKDIQKALNIPVVISHKNGEFDVTLKTIMRKKNFASPDKIVNI